jgi:hypothetical protein
MQSFNIRRAGDAWNAADKASFEGGGGGVTLWEGAGGGGDNMSILSLGESVLASHTLSDGQSRVPPATPATFGGGGAPNVGSGRKKLQLELPGDPLAAGGGAIAGGARAGAGGAATGFCF